MKKLLIVGASGLVGKALAKKCENDFDVYGTYFTSATNLPDNKQFQMNIQDGEVLKTILNTVEPDIIISCLHGDFEQLLEFHRLLAVELKNKSSLLYFLSTTNVFDGDLSRHHSETDEPNSKSEYGQYKINCEIMLQDLLKERAIIIRIPGIWGKNSPRFNTLLKNLETNEPIQAYCNLECSFLTDVHLAQQLHFVLKNEVRGTIHLSSEDKIIESQFYEEIIKKLTPNEIKVQYNHYQDKEKLYLFGLDSIRNEFPKTLNIKNNEIIDYLARKTVDQI
ncbi:dTDP-4-dehydrorhamnose reductase [Solibacillus sp. R5-41]|uniref:sugar nucleotide-binding protein n=1 Tax=Solibacillus sp. R5-41 TaxID=2048654 RepID=UPI000C126CB7|nr:sugar nucleotide-binding protein [Solibacillus sp. R5-41]ATP40062.1 dTDP-4-dehydrorhamnose reductase [Solibacillus sp. R5-41]